MQASLEVLKLFLDRLGVASSISSVHDRKRIQKAIYLGQRAGVDLGYRFSWYVKGPYSSSLADDYYSLDEAIKMNDTTFRGKTLHPSLTNRLDSIAGLFSVPTDIGLSQEDWLELLASLDYLKVVRNYDSAMARTELMSCKPHLFNPPEHFDRAEELLSQYSGALPHGAI